MSTQTMTAIQQHAFGGPQVLRYEDAPKPEMKTKGELLIRVHAVGINPPDWYLRDGYKTLPPEWRPQIIFPLILGTDISGVVEAVADDVKDFSVGDEVYSMVRFPTGMAGKAGRMPSTSPRRRRTLHASRPPSITCMPPLRPCRCSPHGSS